jgi:hypothetical protein
MKSRYWKLFIFFMAFSSLAFVIPSLFASSGVSHDAAPFPRPIDSYNDAHLDNIWDILKHRVSVEPFNLVSLLIFICAIFHTFFSNKLHQISEHLEHRHATHLKKKIEASKSFELKVDDNVSFSAEMMYFLGEVEVVFGVWVIPLLIAIIYYFTWETGTNYINNSNFTEPMFVFVVMTLSATRPIVQLVESLLGIIAKSLGKGSPQAWWLTILTIAPLLGSIVTEPGAMTIGAILLGKQFYQYAPRKTFAYATLGLLFVNISIGGVLTNFAAPPILMVATKWGWSSSFIFFNFGWKAILAIILSNLLYFLVFRKDFASLQIEEKPDDQYILPARPVPIWITIVHIFMLVWVVIHSHHPVLFLGPFIMFIGFHQATFPHQNKMNLRPPILVSFFLAGLIIHGGLQSWWIAPILSHLSETSLMLGATVLTAFNDNAVITYLTTTIPGFPEHFKYAVVSGAITGGGLTVIANAPNPAGQVLLHKYFDNGISPIGLFLAALAPTLIAFMCFWLLQ